MFKHTLIKRSLAAGLTIGAASFPMAAQARPIELSAAPVASQPAQIVSPSALQQPSSSAQSGFEWGDAGLGAAGTVVLLSAGAGASSVLRRRRAHRPVTG